MPIKCALVGVPPSFEFRSDSRGIVDSAGVVGFPVKQIAFDESGNTGNDLIAADQPVFCLASVDVGKSEMAELTKLLTVVKAKEWKFSKMRRNPSQLSLLQNLIEMEWVTPATVKIFVILKRYMAITKLVDLVHEPSARAFGLNLYEQGGARALANLLFLTLPVYLGKTRADRFVNMFVELVRRKDADSLRQFHRETASAHSYLERRFPESSSLLAPIVLACQNPAEWVPYLAATELDPLIPAYHTLANEWGKTLGERFIVLADESKTLAAERGLLLQFSDPGLRDQTIGSPTRNIVYPLKVADVVTTTSDASRSVQIADLFAGIVTYAFAPMANRTSANEHCRRFIKDLCEHVWIDGIIPSADVTPEQLGMEDFVGVNPPEYGARILAGDPATRR